MKKLLFIDIVFLFHLIIILPILTFLYVAYSTTYLGTYETAIGILILWAILMPYPFYWYWNKRIKSI